MTIDDLALPLGVVICGRRGSGKSHAAKLMVQEALRFGRRVAWVRPAAFQAPEDDLDVAVQQFVVQDADQVPAVLGDSCYQLVVLDSVDQMTSSRADASLVADRLAEALGAQVVLTCAL